VYDNNLKKYYFNFFVKEIIQKIVEILKICVKIIIEITNYK